MEDKQTQPSSTQTSTERTGPTLSVPVLLSKAKWDKEQLISDLKKD